MDFYASCRLFKKKCLLACSDHFLYYNLPKKTFPKTYIQLFIWTPFFDICFDEFFFRRRRPANQNKQQMSEKKEFQLKVKYKSWEWFFWVSYNINLI